MPRGAVGNRHARADGGFTTARAGSTAERLACRCKPYRDQEKRNAAAGGGGVVKRANVRQAFGGPDTCTHACTHVLLRVSGEEWDSKVHVKSVMNKRGTYFPTSSMTGAGHIRNVSFTSAGFSSGKQRQDFTEGF